VTAITCRVQNPHQNINPQVWRCEGCHCFHLRAGQVLLTFTPKEFEAFSADIAECYCVQMFPSESSERGQLVF
jgi:hypothetical protein